MADAGSLAGPQFHHGKDVEVCERQESSSGWHAAQHLQACEGFWRPQARF